jgi:hypothetical protein
MEATYETASAGDGAERTVEVKSREDGRLRCVDAVVVHMVVLSWCIWLWVIVIVIDHDAIMNTKATLPARDDDAVNRLFFGLENCLKGIHNSNCKIA